jgi:UDP-N-acetylmuramate--alanine ligase
LNRERWNYQFRHVRRIHFIGIGGVGMSGIAEVLLNEGCAISGSDLCENLFTKRLAGLGAKIYKGHNPQFVKGAEVVVTSSAVQPDNVEVVEAKRLGIPVLPRAAMLAELMRFRLGIAVSGTHGKTTVTSLIASMMLKAGLDPTFVIGGRLNSLDANSHLGTSKYLVAEADESDSSFLHLQPMLSIVTNIDLDHMETYQHDEAVLKKTFISFLQNLPFYGLAVLCIEDPRIQSILPEVSRPILTYGFDERADVRAVNVCQKGTISYFDVWRRGQSKLSIQLNMGGEHNVLNALAAISVATDLGISDELLVKALKEFDGVARRFQRLGDYRLAKGEAIFIDDYGHHPTELAAVLNTAKKSWPDRRIVMVFQPHRYSRTRDLFHDFVDVLLQTDVLLLLNVYAAGETALPGINSDTLYQAILEKNEKHKSFLVRNEKLLPQMFEGILQDGDIVLIQGAGSVSKIGRNLMDNQINRDNANVG